jgi:hypothetical protein
MRTLLIWKSTRLAQSETRHNVRDLSDLQDLIRTEFADRMIYMEARETDSGDAMDSRLRVSPDDLTDDDFHWLTAPVKNEVRGVKT